MSSAIHFALTLDIINLSQNQAKFIADDILMFVFYF